MLIALALLPIHGRARTAEGAGTWKPPPCPPVVLATAAPEWTEEALPSRADPPAVGPRDVLRIASIVRGVRAAPSDAPDTAAGAVDGSVATAWRGARASARWEWRATFRKPVHLAVLRAAFGASPTSGVPTGYRWEARPPRADDGSCRDDERAFEAIAGAEQAAPAVPPSNPAAPTRRSWFVDVDACALRLVVDRTNGGPPVLRELAAHEGARDVLRGAVATDDGALAGFPAEGAIDGTYAGRWVGAPGRDRWTLVVRLAEPTPIDRVRLVLGYDATGHDRTEPIAGVGRTYAIAWGPVRYELEGSEDGERFTPIASTPVREDGTIVPLRRRLVRVPHARALRALRLVMHGATGPHGWPQRSGVPVVREIEAYRADDPRAVIPPPWILSVNANPAIAVHGHPGSEVTNDSYHAKILQQRLGSLFPALHRDDRYARSLSPNGLFVNTAPRDADGEALESIEGDDAELDDALLAQSSPPPITILSGSNDWDYGPRTELDVTTGRKRWYWDPLPDARLGGMGQLHRAVKDRVAPLVGFCGGAQILALLEAKPYDDDDASDGEIIDSVLRRTTGGPVRGYAPPSAVSRSWPGELWDRAEIRFDPSDRLFWDIAGPSRARRASREFLESHVDVVRPDAFLPGGPLERFAVVATSDFCGDAVVDAGPRDPAHFDPFWRRCATVTEVFRAKGAAWPLLGVQAHAEQPRDFAVAGPGDPPEAPADPKLFLAAAIEEIVDAYLRNAR